MAQITPASTSRLDEDDLDPAAFLQSVRELSAKREREDNERFRKLEAEIEKGRQERLARRAEYARSISPEKRDSFVRPSQTQSAPRATTASDTTGISTPSSALTTADTPSSHSSAIEEVPEFAGFGPAKKASTPVMTSPSPIAQALMTPTPMPVSKPSPSAAMPGRSGTLKWQQRPQSRVGSNRPLSMVAIENSTQKKDDTDEIQDMSRDQIAASLSARDPSWFRQTADRGIGSAAYRKSTDEANDKDMVSSGRQGLPGMTRDTIVNSAAPTADVTRTDEQQRIVLSPERSASSSKDAGEFIESAFMRRSNSINKRANAASTGFDRASIIRGNASLQGSHSMPRLDQPKNDPVDATDSLVRPLSNINLAGSKPRAAHHSRAKSITSAYTVNDGSISQPSSPSKRWSPNKSSWIESALTAKPDSRPASPTKNSQPTWMSNLAKANAQRNGSSQSVDGDTTAVPQNDAAAERMASNGLSEGVVSASTTPRIDSSNSVASRSDEVQASPEIKSTTDARSPLARPQPSPKPQLSFNSQFAPMKPEPLPTAAADTVSAGTPSKKPQPSPKPQIDFRSSLKPRAATEPAPQEQPEFMSRFGTLRKTTTEKYVAPDILKSNILRGKAGLATTDGPQKQEPRDEFKESLLAKKGQWQQEKQDGTIKRALPVPATPDKPEALTRRDLLSRPATTQEKEKATTPEALRRHQSVRAKPVVTADAASEIKTSTTNETSKLAARFNPGLAGILARGPPNIGTKDNASAPRVADSGAEQLSEAAATAQLQDMRKGRARGPKKRKGGTRSADAPEDDLHILDSSDASPVFASRTKRDIQSSAKLIESPKPTMMSTEATTTMSAGVPEFKGFTKPTPFEVMHDDKENSTNDKLDSSALPSPSLKDEEAAMRSAMLLASNGPKSARSGLGITGAAPMKPMRSSRTVSGQLHEASLNKVIPGLPDTTVGRIDIKAAFKKAPAPLYGRTMRRTLYKLQAHTLTLLVGSQEYTLCETSTYLLKHDQVRFNGTITTEVYIWLGKRALVDDIKMMQMAAGRMTASARSTTLHTICQGYETSDFLHAIGGILMTMSDEILDTYMLCGRKHLDHVVFDEVPCRASSLCPAFVYLARSQDTVFIWKGSACSPEEIGATRLAAMDLSETGNAVEIEEGFETTSFWKVFDSWPMREDTTCPDALRRKSSAPSDFNVRLFKIQKQQSKPGFFTSMFSRRPSWTSRPSTPTEPEIKYEAKQVSPFTQADLEAEGVYVLDCYTRIDMLLGPLSDSRTHTGEAMYRYALQFTEEYLDYCMTNEKRALKPEAYVVLSGVPDHIPCIFRHWSSEHGLWGTAALMAGSSTIEMEKLDTQAGTSSKM